VTNHGLVIQQTITQPRAHWLGLKLLAGSRGRDQTKERPWHSRLSVGCRANYPTQKGQSTYIEIYISPVT